MSLGLREPTAAHAGFLDGVDCPDMVLVPPGSFTMGATVDDKFASVIEGPAHRVRIESCFAISRHPVTFAQWDAFAGETRGAPRPRDGGWGRGSLPVVNVSWDDVQGYLRWLTKVAQRRYRLPSEAEWEYACRAGTDTIFNTGSTLTVEQANFMYLDFGDRPGPGRPVAVGSYPPNAFGLHDMHGNVCELVADVWHDTYDGAPSDGSARTEPAASALRVVRGGGWDGLPRILRAAFRDWVRRDQRMDNMGFRVACDVP